MDPQNPASAPQQGWSNEKSSMGQAYPPPPYQDNYTGQPQPGPGYPPQGYGYQQQYGGVQQPYQGQPGITVQPTVYLAQAPLTDPVNDYLGYSIFTMLCCCLPLGIAALIYSISAREANHSGNRLAAERSSRTARILNHVALGVGLGVIILCIVYVAVVASAIH